jgi:hypothetical protein
MEFAKSLTEAWAALTDRAGSTQNGEPAVPTLASAERAEAAAFAGLN